MMMFARTLWLCWCFDLFNDASAFANMVTTGVCLVVWYLPTTKTNPLSTWSKGESLIFLGRTISEKLFSTDIYLRGMKFEKLCSAAEKCRKMQKNIWKIIPADIFLRRSGDSCGAVHSRLPSNPQGRTIFHLNCCCILFSTWIGNGGQIVWIWIMCMKKCVIQEAFEYDHS